MTLLRILAAVAGSSLMTLCAWVVVAVCTVLDHTLWRSKELPGD